MLDAVALTALAVLRGQSKQLLALRNRFTVDRPTWLWVDRAWDSTPLTVRFGAAKEYRSLAPKLPLNFMLGWATGDVVAGVQQVTLLTPVPKLPDGLVVVCNLGARKWIGSV